MAKFDNAFEQASQFEFDKFKFDEPDYNMLMFDEDSYLEHLRVQSAGVAYFGTLSKTADREYEDAERRYRIRYNELYSECSDILSRTGQKNNVRDIEALVRCKYEPELEKWEKRISELKSYKDSANTFFEAWKAKGFSLNAMTQMITSGLLTPRNTISEEDMENARNRRMDVSEAHKILGRK